MPRKSLIDDVELSEEDDKGEPIIFANQEIRQMLALVEAGTKDIFCDVGCGWGQNLIIALTEFEVARAIGIEKDISRKRKCEERLTKWEKHDPSLRGRWRVIEGDFDDLFASKIPRDDFGDMTIVFYGLTTYQGLAENIGRHLGRGARLVYYFNGLFPEMLPDKVDFPFYASVYPFRKPKSEAEWLHEIVGKKYSTLEIGQQPLVSELWDELKHDTDIYGDWKTVSDYKRRIKKCLQRKD